MAEPLILAADLGSTSLKVAVFDAHLRRLGAADLDVRYLSTPPPAVELDAAEAREDLARALGEALRAAGVAGASLASVALSSQAQTFAVFGPDGRARTPFLSWLDRRGEQGARPLREALDAREFARHTGMGFVSGGLQVSLVRYLRDARPELFVPENAFLQLPSFVVRELTGAPWIDENLAAMSGLYSLPGRDWWPAALDAASLTPAQLPRLAAMGAAPARTGAGAAAFGLPAGLPVVLAGNDQTACAYGAAIHEHGAILLTLGTAQVAYVCSDERLPTAPGAMTGPYPGGRFYKLLCSAGGSVLSDACAHIEGCETVADLLRLAADSPPGARGIRFAFDRTGATDPWRDLRGAPADRARAVLEALVDELAGYVHALAEDWRARPLFVTGGGTRSELWPRLVGERLGTTLRPVDADPLLGAARLALELAGPAD